MHGPEIQIGLLQVHGGIFEEQDCPELSGCYITLLIGVTKPKVRSSHLHLRQVQVLQGRTRPKQSP